jgi:ubiquinone/menaquinone biosynthesis C-methylase UbiE
MDNHPKDPKQSFAEKMTMVLNHGALNLALGMGYELGLLDALDTFSDPCTIDALAEKTSLNARYIKEWLGVMVAGGVVTLCEDDGNEARFSLPEAHGALLTRRAGNANLGVYMQEIPLLTRCAWDAVSRGFRTGKGVGYEHYPDFQQFMGELANAKHRQVLVDRFLPSVDNGRIVQALHSGITACDLGCAEGVAVLLMAKAFPRSRFVGIDISAEAIAAAKARCRDKGLDNATFRVKDAAVLEGETDLKDRFDYVTAFDAIHDQTCPEKALRGVWSILKEGGDFSMVDIAADSRLMVNRDHPMGPFLYTVSLMHCMPVGLVNGGAGLGMMWGKQTAVAMIKEAGFSDVTVTEIPGDPFNLHFWACK